MKNKITITGDRVENWDPLDSFGEGQLLYVDGSDKVYIKDYYGNAISLSDGDAYPNKTTQKFRKVPSKTKILIEIL